MDDLVAFLLARLAEEGDLAEAGDGESPDLTLRLDDAHRWISMTPARLLADIDSKRRTLVRCQEEMLSGIPRLVWFARQTMWEMALPYRWEKGFKEEWRPRAP